jgi:hypothetical protein
MGAWAIHGAGEFTVHFISRLKRLELAVIAVVYSNGKAPRLLADRTYYGRRRVKWDGVTITVKSRTGTSR